MLTSYFASAAGFTLITRNNAAYQSRLKNRNILLMLCFMPDFTGRSKIKYLFSLRSFYDDKGCSLVLLHSHKGERLFQEAQKELLIKEIPRGQVERSQPHLYKPTEKPEQYQAFWEDYGRLSFDELIKKYAVNTVKKAGRMAIV